MSNNDSTTFNIQNPGERTTVSADVLYLKDHSREMVTTDDPTQFASLFRDLSGGQCDLIAYFGEFGAHVADQLEPVDRHKNAILKLILSSHPRLERLIGISGKSLSLPEAEAFLSSMRKNIDKNGTYLLMNSRSFKSVKKLTMEHKKSPNGDMAMSVSMNGVPDEDFFMPESLVFTVPLYNRIPLMVELEFDFRISIGDIKPDGSMPVSFIFESLNLKEDLMAARRMILEQWFTQVRAEGANLECPLDKDRFIWGTMSIHPYDNAWSVVQNRFDGLTRLEK